MKSNYKRLGDYIHKVDNRNHSLNVNKLLGLSMTKEFRESTSNIVGTDMSVYKVMKKWQFACDFMSVIRVFKLPVVLKTDDEPIIVSPAYTVFEVNNSNELLPEYLMMWFRRAEFDRYAFFKCDSAIRGGFDWTELCDTTLPIPSLEKQQAIVNEYNVLQNRIAINKKMNQKLEETAQAIYKQWFVDFEFPDENGNPYKSSGGEMVESVLGEIPKGWEVGTLKNIANLFSGFAFKGEEYSFEEGVSVVRGENVSTQRLRWDTHKKWNKSTNGLNNYFLKEWDIVIGMDGSKVGKNWALVSRYDLPLLLAQRVSCIREKKVNMQLYLYYSMQVLSFSDYVAQVQTGTSIPHISGSQILGFATLIPSEYSLYSFNDVVTKIVNNRIILDNQNITLIKILQILLSKLATLSHD